MKINPTKSPNKFFILSLSAASKYFVIFKDILLSAKKFLLHIRNQNCLFHLESFCYIDYISVNTTYLHVLSGRSQIWLRVTRYILFLCFIIISKDDRFFCDEQHLLNVKKNNFYFCRQKCSRVLYSKIDFFIIFN